MNEVKQEGEDVEMTKSDDDSDMHRSDEEDADKSDASGSDPDQDESPFKPSLKRRKQNHLVDSPEEVRTIDVKKWTLLPATIADTHPERSFLAPRRPGMPPLYRSELTSKLFSQYDTTNHHIHAGVAGYDLGEGGGLANASAVTSVAPQATPSRRNAPPRRKKKKLGGPGRRKTARDPVSEQTTATGTTIPSTPAEDNPLASAAIPTVTTENTEIDEEAMSGSENEGSEEGEIDETPHSPGQNPHPADPVTSTTEPSGVPPPSHPVPISSTITDLPEPPSPAPPASNPFDDTDEAVPAATAETLEVANIDTTEDMSAPDRADGVEEIDTASTPVVTEHAPAESAAEAEAEVEMEVEVKAAAAEAEAKAEKETEVQAEHFATADAGTPTAATAPTATTTTPPPAPTTTTTTSTSTITSDGDLLDKLEKDLDA